MDDSYSITHQYLESEKILHFKFSGSFDPGNSAQNVTSNNKIIEEHKCVKVLFDFLEVKRALSMGSEYQRAKIVDQSGTSRIPKYAIVYQSITDELVFSELAYSNRGFKVKYFNSIEGAKNWLLDE